MAKKSVKIVLTKTVGYEGNHYPPGTVHEWPKDIADELIEKDAAEPVLDVKPAASEQEG